MIILHIILAILLAEFFGGLFHWWEDRYGNPNWPIIGKYIVQPNIDHHKRPGFFCTKSYLDRNAIVLIPCLLMAFGLYWLEAPLFLILSFCILSHMNEIHSWAHKKSNFVVIFFQKLGILQSPEHHKIHHERPYDKHYCVMTNYVNPVLRKLKFWEILETLVWFILRVTPLPNRTIY